MKRSRREILETRRAADLCKLCYSIILYMPTIHFKGNQIHMIKTSFATHNRYRYPYIPARVNVPCYHSPSRKSGLDAFFRELLQRRKFHAEGDKARVWQRRLFVQADLRLVLVLWRM